MTGLFSSANILQIADVVGRIVFLLFLQFWANSSPISFSWNEWNVPPFCIHYQNNSNSILLHHWRHHFTYRKILPNWVNGSWFWWIIRGILANQKRKMKYFEWIIISKYWMRLSRTDVENCVDWRRRYYSKSQRHPNFWKISVRKTIWDLEFSEYLF